MFATRWKQVQKYGNGELGSVADLKRLSRVGVNAKATLKSSARRGVTACLIAGAAGIALIGTWMQGGNAQQTVVTSTAGIVVIAIPGFPLESILLGILVGLLALAVIRRRRRLQQ